MDGRKPWVGTEWTEEHDALLAADPTLCVPWSALPLPKQTTVCYARPDDFVERYGPMFESVPFKEQPVVPNQPVLWDSPAERAGNDVPEFAALFMKRWPTHLVQAGSATLSSVARGLDIPSQDCDFYFVGVHSSFAR